MPKQVIIWTMIMAAVIVTIMLYFADIRDAIAERQLHDKAETDRVFFKDINMAVKMYKDEVGDFPFKLEDLRTDPGVDGWNGPYIGLPEKPKDVFGRPIKYFIHMNVPHIAAMGVDGEWGTRDDVVAIYTNDVKMLYFK